MDTCTVKPTNNTMESGQSQHMSLANLPTELLIQVFSHLDPQTLQEMGLVCHSWHNLIKDNTVWYRVFVARYPRAVPVFSATLRTKSWRRELIHRDELLCAWTRGRSSVRTYSLARDLSRPSSVLADFQRGRMLAYDATMGGLLTCDLSSGRGISHALCAIPAGCTTYSVGRHFMIFGRWDGSVYGSLLERKNILCAGMRRLQTAPGRHSGLITASAVCRGDLPKQGIPGAFTGDINGTIHAWDVRTGECLARIALGADRRATGVAQAPTDASSTNVPTEAPSPNAPTDASSTNAPTAHAPTAHAHTRSFRQQPSSLSQNDIPSSQNAIVRLESDGRRYLIALLSSGKVYLIENIFSMHEKAGSAPQITNIGQFKSQGLSADPSSWVGVQMCTDYGGQNVVVFNQSRLEVFSFDGESSSVLALAPAQQISIAALECGGHAMVARERSVVGGDPLLMAVVLRSGEVLIVNVRAGIFNLQPMTRIEPQLLCAWRDAEEVPDPGTAPITAVALNGLVVVVGSRDGAAEMYDVMSGEFCRRVSDGPSRKMRAGAGGAVIAGGAGRAGAPLLPVSTIILDDKTASGVLELGPVIQFFEFGDHYGQRHKNEHQNAKKNRQREKKAAEDEIKSRVRDYEYQEEQREREYDMVAQYNGDDSSSAEQLEMALALSASIQSSEQGENCVGEGDLTPEEMRQIERMEREEERQRQARARVLREAQQAREADEQAQARQRQEEEDLRLAIRLSLLDTGAPPGQGSSDSRGMDN